MELVKKLSKYTLTKQSDIAQLNIEWKEIKDKVGGVIQLCPCFVTTAKKEEIECYKYIASLGSGYCDQHLVCMDHLLLHSEQLIPWSKTTLDVSLIKK